MKASHFSDARRQPGGGVDFTSRSRRRKCPHDPQPGHRARRPPRGPGVRVGSCGHRLALRDSAAKAHGARRGVSTDLGQGRRALRPRHSLRGRTISPSRRSRCSPTATSPSPGPDLRTDRAQRVRFHRTDAGGECICAGARSSAGARSFADQTRRTLLREHWAAREPAARRRLRNRPCLDCPANDRVSFCAGLCPLPDSCDADGGTPERQDRARASGDHLFSRYHCGNLINFPPCSKEASSRSRRSRTSLLRPSDQVC